MNHYLFLLLFLLIYSISGHSQETSTVEIEPLVNISIRQINVDSFPLVKVGVHTSIAKGAGLPTLSAENFGITEDHTPQQIINFSPIDKRVNSFSVLLLDHSQEMGTAIRNDMDNYDDSEEQSRLLHAKAASMILFGSLDHTHDSLMLMGYARDVDVITEMDAAVIQLARVYDQMEVANEPSALYDAIKQAIEPLLKKQGIRNVYIVTSGESGNSSISADSVSMIASAGKVKINIAAIGASDTLNLKKLATETGGTYQFVENVSQLRHFFHDQLREQEQSYELYYRTSHAVSDTNIRVIRMTAQGTNLFLANGESTYQLLLMEDSQPSEKIAFDFMNAWPKNLGEVQTLLEAYGLYIGAVILALILLFILLRIARRRADANLIVPAITKMPEEVSKNSMRVRIASPYKDKPAKFTIYSAGGKPIQDFIFKGTRRRARIKLKSLPDGAYKCNLANGGHVSESRNFRLERKK